MTALLSRRLASDTRGAAIVEFALIAPVLLITMMGIFDLGYNMYATSMLQGAIQKAARDSTLEGSAGSEAALDALVADAVHDIVPGAEMTYARTAYTSFSDVRQPEDYTDVDGDGICNNGEPFEDANANGSWDADRGTEGQGGARDAVLYEVTISYPRAFPIASLIGQSNQFTTVAKTVLRNQPYNLQQTSAPTTGNCT
ncbi:MAG TPA: TadE family protein [Novosphingobium sp.]|nr:TadE family protein [Novosphingobium sp.]